MAARATAASLTAALLILTPVHGSAQDPPPRILYTTSPRAIEYQLSRLSNADLVRVERRANDPTFRPVYLALLTRPGLGREYFEEALEALTRMDKTSQAAVLLQGLERAGSDDAVADRLLRVLLAQPAERLRADREAFAEAIAHGSPPAVLRGAYGAKMVADGDPQPAWETAVKHDGHLVELLRSVPYLGSADSVRDQLFEPIAALLPATQDGATRTAALSALGWTRVDTGTFRLLAGEVLQGSDPDMRAAAIRSLGRVPEAHWPKGEVEPLARAIVDLVKAAPPKVRTEPAMIEAIQLGERLADALPDDRRRALRRDLRALGVQVVRIEAVPEQMAFDLKWFAVEAGRPVQIVLYNPDAMSHNLLVVQPGSFQEVGIAASTMPLPADPAVKPYVPDSPLVLHATGLLNWGETERLSFTAPAAPGEYEYVCTFPGHWVRMYGVMLVVESLDAWEAKRTVPTDPMTGQPFSSQRH